MTLRLYDTASQGVREFRPVIPGRASVYLCGEAVHEGPRIGHLRSAVCCDILIRWLEASGYLVTYCRGVTDLDDGVLRAAAAEGVPWWALAERGARARARACDLLGCRPPDIEPRVTGHIPDMIALTSRLIDRGHAFPAADGVYFDAPSVPGYGALSRHRPDGPRPAAAAARTAAAGAAAPDGRSRPDGPGLWRDAGPGEPSWRTPWGDRRPGRHLGCAALSAAYLGDSYDIHAGGIDLLFPRHESERAQSLAAGGGSAGYWVHHGPVSAAGQDAGETAGTAGPELAAAAALCRARPQELRYYLAHAHYRSAFSYSCDGLDEAVTAYRRIERFVTRAQHALGGAAPAARMPISFTEAMDGDLGLPAALAAVHAAVRDGNYALGTGDTESAGTCLAQVRAMLAVLGLDPLDPGWRLSDPGGRLRAAVDALVGLALRQREAARARGDYAAADSIRATLEAAGVVVEDTPEGPRWELAR